MVYNSGVLFPPPTLKFWNDSNLSSYVWLWTQFWIKREWYNLLMLYLTTYTPKIRLFIVNCRGNRDRHVPSGGETSRATEHPHSANWVLGNRKWGKKKQQTNTVALLREGTIPNERPPIVGEVSDNFCGYMLSRGQRDGSLWPYSRSRYFFSQVAPQLYSRGWVDPFPDTLLLRKFGSAWNRTWTSGSVARNSDQ
jgi:hypothetical protein